MSIIKCPICCKIFNLKIQLNVHIKQHQQTIKNLFQCNDCERWFLTKGNLQQHLRTHTTEKPYKCSVLYCGCGKRFTQLSHLQQHYRVNFQISDKKFVHRTSLKKHLRIHTDEKSEEKPHDLPCYNENLDEKMAYNCSVCPESFKSRILFNRHMKKHCSQSTSDDSQWSDETNENKKTHRCEHCQKLISDTNIAAHMRIHSNDKPYECSVCQKRFTQKSQLQQHERIHTKEKPYSCLYCQKNFTQQSHLKQHYRRHTGETPYECTYCQKRFKQLSGLKCHQSVHTETSVLRCEHCQKLISNTNIAAHMRIHSSDKPFECSVCQKRFTQKSQLQQHERVHTKEKPYSCLYCQKKFAQQSHLKQHYRRHTGETPYECTYCQKRFKQLSGLKCHQSVHTGKKTYQRRSV